MNPLRPYEAFAATRSSPPLRQGSQRRRSEDVDRNMAEEQARISAERTELEWWKNRCAVLGQRGRETEERFQSVLGENQKLRDERQATAGSGRLGVAEAATTKAFNSPHNTSSDEDVRGLVDRINNLLEDLASRTAASVTAPVETPCKYDIEHARGDLKERVGSVVADTLYRSSRKDDFGPPLLQMAWQTIILSQVHLVLEHFSATCVMGVEGQADEDRFLKTLALEIESQRTPPMILISDLQ